MNKLFGLVDFVPVDDGTGFLSLDLPGLIEDVLAVIFEQILERRRVLAPWGRRMLRRRPNCAEYLCRGDLASGQRAPSCVLPGAG